MQPQKASQAELSIRAPNGPTQVVSLALDRYELGRADSNALCFPVVQGLSRKHLAFERNGSNWLLRDLGSTNGTFVNGTRITEPRVLRSNDRMTAGDLSIVFLDAAPAGPARSDQTVVFIDKPGPQTTSTQEATLDGVLSGDQEIQGSAHMRALIDAGRELCGHSSLDALFDVIMNLSVDAVRAARGVLITLEEGGEFRVRASKGAGFRISAHVRDLVVKERRSLLVQDALSDEVLAGRMSIVQDQVRGILAVPLQTENRVIGLIYLDSPALIQQFTKDDLNVLQSWRTLPQSVSNRPGWLKSNSLKNCAPENWSMRLSFSARFCPAIFHPFRIARTSNCTPRWFRPRK
jgi:hypothetical protein